MRQKSTYCSALFLLALFTVNVFAEAMQQCVPHSRCIYHFTADPIDVVIPCTLKDLPTLEHCISGIRKNGENIRRVIVVSDQRLSSSAEWFNETQYPFSKWNIARQICDSEAAAETYIRAPNSRIGWIYQQFLKLYAPLVIPDISSNVLVLDADTIFLNRVTFLGRENVGLYNPGFEYHPPYFEHAQRVIPGFKKVFPRFSGICHHMLFQKSVLMDLLNTIEKIHGDSAWKSLCTCIDKREIFDSCMSEYELYFNFVFSRTKQVRIRHLKWIEISSLERLSKLGEEGYHYASCHAYMRK